MSWVQTDATTFGKNTDYQCSLTGWLSHTSGQPHAQEQLANIKRN